MLLWPTRTVNPGGAHRVRLIHHHAGDVGGARFVAPWSEGTMMKPWGRVSERQCAEGRSMNVDGVRWMVSFWHSEGGREDDPDPPSLDNQTSQLQKCPFPQLTGPTVPPATLVLLASDHPSRLQLRNSKKERAS